MDSFFQKETTSRQLVVAFHGTGGNEYQLLTTVAALFPQANLLSFLGDHGSEQSRRFFPPLVNGQLDRALFDQAVAHFINNIWSGIDQKEYDEIILIGYSNGANFILGLLEQVPQLANTVILLHPSNLVYQFHPEVSSAKIILTTGANDTLSLAGDVLKLAHQLEDSYQEVVFLIEDGGHQLSAQEIEHVAAKLV